MLVLRDDFLSPFGLVDDFLFGNTRSYTSSTPKVNALTDEYGLTIETALPGMSLEDVTIEIDDNSRNLTIAADSSNDADNDSATYLFREFTTTSFSRKFKIPRTYNLETANATFTNGILTLTFDKVDSEKQVPHRRRIEIKTK